MLYTVVITATIEAASDEALREMIENQTPPYILEQCYNMNVEVDLGSGVTVTPHSEDYGKCDCDSLHKHNAKLRKLETTDQPSESGRCKFCGELHNMDDDCPATEAK